MIGNLPGGTAEELGFSENTVACSGGHDMLCAAIGSGLGVDDPGTVLNIMGTMEAIIVLSKKPNLTRRMLENRYPSFPGYREYVSLSLNLTSGSVLKWCRDLFSGGSKPAANASSDENSYENLLRSIDSENPGELLLFPHFSGTCNPRFNPDARGFLYGLNLATGKRDIVQSIVEGLCYDLKSHIRGFQEAGFPIQGLKIVGGGAQSDAWLQLKANITGLEIACSELYEASATGAAALAGAALGAIDNPYDAVRFMGKGERRFTPHPEAVKRFEESFNQYRELGRQVAGFESG
jgi:xylulokinase